MTGLIGMKSAGGKDVPLVEDILLGVQALVLRSKRTPKG